MDLAFFGDLKKICRWMGEKFDGIRACWNPSTRTLYVYYLLFRSALGFMPYRYSRAGLCVDVLTEIIFVMPSSTFLDGELWYVHKF